MYSAYIYLRCIRPSWSNGGDFRVGGADLGGLIMPDPEAEAEVEAAEESASSSSGDVAAPDDAVDLSILRNWVMAHALTILTLEKCTPSYLTHFNIASRISTLEILSKI